jgi:DNA-binding CsgD family transcriptional regulator
VQPLAPRQPDLDAVEVTAPAVSLTRRQIDCLQAAADGVSAMEHARRTNYSYQTVREHLQGARRRLGVRSTGQAIARAVALGLVTVDGKRVQMVEVCPSCGGTGRLDGPT